MACTSRKSALIFRDLFDAQRLEVAWAQVIDHHAALRALFLWDGLDTPLQVIRSSVQIPWNNENWQHLTQTDQHQQWQAYLQADRKRGIDFTSAPAMRICLLRLADEKYRLLWTFHHLISDGWSNSLILTQVFKLYESKQPIAIESFDWAEYVNFQHTRDTSEAMRYWHSMLADFSRTTRILNYEKNQLLSHGVAGELATPAGPTAIDRKFTAQSAQALSIYARQNRLTQNTVLLGAWSLLVGMHSRESDIVFGTTVSGRASGYDHIENAVGCCINTLPLRIKLTPSTVETLLQSVQRQQLQSQEYDYSSLADVQRCSGIDAGISLFDSIVVFENYPDKALDGSAGSAITITDLSHVEQSNYPLALLVIPGESLNFRLVYHANQYLSDFASSLVDQIFTFGQ